MSQYAKDMNHILAALNTPESDSDNTTAPLPNDEETENIIHAYPVEGGGLLFTQTPLEEDQQPQPIIDSQEPTPRREPPHFLSFVFILLLFLLLDVADNQLIALMTPTATVTITPTVRTVTIQSTTLLGKVLSPITLTESQTVPTTGHGHQNAQAATGSLTFYNGSFSSQTINAGTVYTGQDGVQVALDQTVTIPAANPPYVGQATVSASALQVGAAGNIQAGDISIKENTLIINNSQFSGGQDSRDFSVVTKADTDTAAATLQAKVTASMTAALQSQLTPAEQMQMKPCSPTVTADHRVGEEATQLTVTVSEMCTAIAYNTKELTDRATRLLTAQAVTTVGKGYMLFGEVKVTVTKADTPNKTGVLLSFTTQGSYAYQLTAPLQERIKTLIAGKPRLEAIHLLSTLPGVRRVTITGITDNNLLPEDGQHITFLVFISL